MTAPLPLSHAAPPLSHTAPPSPLLPDARGTNLYRADPGLAASLRLCIDAELFAHLEPWLERLGALAGGRLDALAATADRHPPRLHVRERNGAERQWIEKHPAYEEMERIAFAEFGLAAMSHRAGVLGWPTPLPPAAKYALSFLFVQAEFGLACPVSMTDALARTLAKFGSPELIARYLPGLTATDMDLHLQGAMFMTEQGAGSDVGASATVARRAPDAAAPSGSPEPGLERWHLHGDKWFCSNADAELAMVLARPEGAPAGTRGLALFLLPRELPDGSPNHYRIVRLKDKLGTRSMASGEIQLESALAYLVGDATRGFVQMADMINTSRLSNGMRAAALMRRAYFEARHVAQHRIAFGQRVIDMPLAQRQLSKILLVAEAARAVMFAAARALQVADAGGVRAEAARRCLRLLTPLLKFRACRDARRATGDAMEVRGGSGYIEEWPDARLLRDAHLGSIWEGTSSIVALDAMRAIAKEDALAALSVELDALEVPAAAGAAAAAPGAQAHGVLTAPQAPSALTQGARSADDESRRAARRRAEHFAREVAHSSSAAEHARQAASGLYYATAATLLDWEGRCIGGALGGQRRLLARALVLHKLLPRDPLAPAPNPAGGDDEALGLLHAAAD